jgi:hypothetical protein
MWYRKRIIDLFYEVYEKCDWPEMAETRRKNIFRRMAGYSGKWLIYSCRKFFKRIFRDKG